MGLLDLVSYGDWNYDQTAANKLSGILGTPGGGLRGNQVHQAMQNGGLLTQPGTGYQGGQTTAMEAAGQIYNMQSNRFNPIAAQMLQTGGAEEQAMLSQQNQLELNQQRQGELRQAATIAHQRDLLKKKAELNQLDPTAVLQRQKNYQGQMSGVQAIETAVRNAEKLITGGTGASDYAMLNAFMKSILPDEAIMEGDVRRAAGMGGLMNTMQSYLSKLKTGEDLQPQDRENMLATMQTLLETAQHFGGVTQGIWQGEESQYGLEPGRITGVSPVDLTYKPKWMQPTGREADPKYQRMIELREKRDALQRGGRR